MHIRLVYTWVGRQRSGEEIQVLVSYLLWMIWVRDIFVAISPEWHHWKLTLCQVCICSKKSTVYVAFGASSIFMCQSGRRLIGSARLAVRQETCIDEKSNAMVAFFKRCVSLKHVNRLRVGRKIWAEIHKILANSNKPINIFGPSIGLQ